jgi:hypothetical protein
MKRRLLILTSAGTLLLAACATAALTAQTALPAGNLVRNPGGEVPFGGDHYVRNVPPAVWQKEDVPAADGRVGEGVQVVRYVAKDGNGLLGKARSAAISGGRNYFSGGYPSHISTAFQLIDVSAAGTEIDAGGVKACVSAYLGGTRNSNVTSRLDVQFVGEDGSPLGQLRLGPVTRGQRKDQYALLRRASSRPVPAATRMLRVSFTSESPDSPSNLGFADNIAVALAKGGSCDPVLVVKCVKKTLVATVKPSATAATQRVRFSVKGGKRTKKVVDGRAPHMARFTMNGLTGRLTVTAAVTQKGGGIVDLVKKSRHC